MLELYRQALPIRREQPALGDGTRMWLETPAGALAFRLDPRFACVVNISADPVAPPQGAKLLLSSGPLTSEGRVPRTSAPGSSGKHSDWAVAL